MNKEIMYSHNVLKAVYFDDAYSSIELNKLLKNSAIESLNKNLITKIVYGVLEKDVFLTYVISQFCAKKPSEEIELLLKIGIYILKYVTGIPNFACVNEIVNLCKKNCSKYVSGFVNATLKKIDQSKITLPKREDNLIKYLSVKYSYPEWLVKLLLENYSEDDVENLLNYSLTTLTHVRIIENNISIDEFVALLNKNKIKYEQSPIKYCLYVDYSELIKIKQLDKLYAVQGVPSIIVGENASKFAKDSALDVCAAPGGKSVLIAMKNENTNIISCDINEKRLKLINEYVSKYEVKNIKTKVNDATVFNSEWEDSFDLVLCDVPCSNLGVCNKKPDVLIRKSINNIKQLPFIQSKILETSSKYVKSGGILIYSTCTILPQENENVVEKFLNSHKDFELINLDSFGINVIKNKGMLTFLPNISETEGFFIGGMIRK